MALDLAIGLCLAALISAGAVISGALTIRAALASTTLGTIVFAAGGVGWSIPLLTFFVTSSLLSRGAGSRRSDTQLERDVTRRTARQVLANGSLPALWAACQLVFPGKNWAILFGSAIATAAADTWATEIGRRSHVPPRDILTGRRVRVGTSGGITPRGVAASLAGSAVVGLASLATRSISLHDASAVMLAGWGGAIADSLLGAALQERRLCPTCLVETENRIHAPCRTPTIHQRGIPGFDNDWVNLSACLIGSGLGLVLTGRV
jgi:uncharacterized protein (TIGR00297 family)